MKCIDFMKRELSDRFNIMVAKTESDLYLLSYKQIEWTYYRKKHFNELSDLIEFLYELNTNGIIQKKRGR